LQFLTQRGLVVPDAARAIDPDRQAIDQHIQTLPAGIGAEISRWILILRGEARRAPTPRTTLPLLTLACTVNNVRRLIKTDF
jgi:hypothetical protein